MQDKPDDDPTRFLDGWRPRVEPQARAPMPQLDLSALGGGPALDAGRIERLKQRGFSMSDVEDVELLPARRPVSARAADPRLLTHWQPGAWTGVCRCLREAATGVALTPEGPRVEQRAAQWLLAAWPPQGLDAPLLGRWPAYALLCEGDTAENAVAALLGGLPATARLLWISPALEVDWGLLAELVLHRDPALVPHQRLALGETVEAERRAARARIEGGYEPAANGQLLRRKT